MTGRPSEKEIKEINRHPLNQAILPALRELEKRPDGEEWGPNPMTEMYLETLLRWGMERAEGVHVSYDPMERSWVRDWLEEMVADPDPKKTLALFLAEEGDPLGEEHVIADPEDLKGKSPEGMLEILYQIMIVNLRNQEGWKDILATR